MDCAAGHCDLHCPRALVQKIRTQHCYNFIYR
jgi:hypothetical protein